MKKIILFGFILLLLAISIGIVSETGIRDRSSGLSSSANAKSQAGLEPDAGPISRGGRILSQAEFSSKFALSGIDSLKISRELSDVAIALLEEKGAAAFVQEHRDGHLVLVVPKLDLGLGELRGRVRDAIEIVVGAERASTITSDPDGLATLLAQIGSERLAWDTVFSFDKMKQEGDVEKGGSMEYARFIVNINYLDNSVVKMRLKHNGFVFSDAYSVDLAWNAMAKAPSEFFRREPILGVASRPPRAPTIIDNQSSDEIEVRDIRSPGSRDIIPPKV